MVNKFKYSRSDFGKGYIVEEISESTMQGSGGVGVLRIKIRGIQLNMEMAAAMHNNVVPPTII